MDLAVSKSHPEETEGSYPGVVININPGEDAVKKDNNSENRNGRKNKTNPNN